MDDNRLVNCLAWEMECPTEAGGKVYLVALMDGWFVTAWGPRDGNLAVSWKIGGAPEARRVTKTREKHGYTLVGTPQQRLVKVGLIHEIRRDALASPGRVHRLTAGLIRSVLLGGVNDAALLTADSIALRHHYPTVGA